MLWDQSSVIEKGLMLSHSVVERDIIILHPTSERMEQEDWVLVTLLHKLLSSILQQEAMTIVEWVSNLECVNGISSSLLSDVSDLLWSKSIFIQTVIEFDVLGESHGLS